MLIQQKKYDEAVGKFRNLLFLCKNNNKNDEKNEINDNNNNENKEKIECRAEYY
jgi:hypothetical protein